MLDKMREGSQGPAAKIILSVIILSFALAGVSGYLIGGGSSVAVQVNDQEISHASVEQAYQNERSSLQQQYGDQFDTLASNPNFAQQVRAKATQKLISDALINQAIAEMGLRVGDDQIKAEIRNMDEFKVDGKFNNDRYLSLLRRASYTPAQFSATLKADLARRQLLQMLVGSEFVLPEEVALANQLQTQQRIAKILNVSVADFEDAALVNEADISAYYEENKQLFQYPEQVSADYILLDGSALADQIMINQTDLETYYENHKSDYQRVERRKVAHILVQGVTEDAQKKAAAILDELQNGADFAQLATEKSDDTYSAKNNGELDWIEQGVMDPEFDKAAFLLTKDAPLSGLVKSQFGYHIIKLVDIEESETQSFAAVKTQVESALQQDKMEELYFDLQQQLGEVAFESPDSLDEAAATVNLQILHSELFSADQAPEDLANSKVLQILFNEDFQNEGLNSEVIEIDDNKAIVVRVNEYKAAAAQPLAEVADLISSQLKTEQARVKAQEFVESLTAKLNAQESIASLLAEKNISFSDKQTIARYSRDVDYQVVQKIFKIAKPDMNKVTQDWTTTSNGDFAVIELFDVIDGQPAADETKEQLTNLLTRSASEATYQAFVMQLMENADIKYPTAD